MKEDRKVKTLASYLTGFIKFIDYDDGEKYYNYCIAGSQELADAVSSASRYSMSERVVNAYTIADESSIDKCHILFISSENMPKFKDVGKYTNTLTVSDTLAFIKDYNGMVEIRDKSENYTFAINVKKVNSAKFKVSSKLAELAENTY